MAFHLQIPTGSSSFLPYLPTTVRTCRHDRLVTQRFRCVSSLQIMDIEARRRTEYYQPTIWDYNFIESLSSDYMRDTYMTEAQKLEDEVRGMLEMAQKPSKQLELIDVMQRLGVSYLFENEIDRIIKDIYMKAGDDPQLKEDLCTASLHFRLLRQNGYQVSQDVFQRFMDKAGNFDESLREDVKGMLSLYEASHLAADDDGILEEARKFTTKHLKSIEGKIDTYLANQVSHALELPLHWRMQRSEARWFIEAYEKQPDRNPVLLEFAKLDFNKVQATHQDDLREASRWWRKLGLTVRLNFARDRLVKSFLWSLGFTFEPQYSRCRDWLTKVMNFVLVIDDIYDIYGSLEELELFTEAVDSWDTRVMNKLPDYLKLCFLALYNTTNDIAYYALKEQNLDALPYLKKSWADFCKSQLVESRWFMKGYSPSLQEYLNNGWISSSGIVFLVHAYFATSQEINYYVFESLENNPELMYGSAMIFRLANDLATSSAELKRGDVPSSIQCYMRENGVSEQVAREYVAGLIREMWRKMNKSLKDSSFPLPFVHLSLNLARTALGIYQRGDGLGSEEEKSKNVVLSLLVEPIGVKVQETPANIYN